MRLNEIVQISEIMPRGFSDDIKMPPQLFKPFVDGLKLLVDCFSWIAL